LRYIDERARSVACRDAGAVRPIWKARCNFEQVARLLRIHGDELAVDTQVPIVNSRSVFKEQVPWCSLQRKQPRDGPNLPIFRRERSVDTYSGVRCSANSLATSQICPIFDAKGRWTPTDTKGRWTPTPRASCAVETDSWGRCGAILCLAAEQIWRVFDTKGRWTPTVIGRSNQRTP